MHLDDTTLEHLARGALPTERLAAARAHLEGCEQCRERLEDARLFGLLEHLDEPPPDIDAGAVIARAERTRHRGWTRWAAGLALTLGAAGAVYAAPGSPLPGWLASLTRPEAEAVGERPADPRDVSGVVLSPGERLVIELSPQRSGTLTLELVDDADVTVRATGGSARFDSGAERLVVTAVGTSELHVALPRSAPDVRVDVGAETVFRLEAGRVTTTAESRGEARWVHPLGTR